MDGKEIDAEGADFVNRVVEQMMSEFDVEVVNPWLVARRIAIMLLAERKQKQGGS